MSSRLLASSAKRSYDPLVDIDWDAPTPTDRYGLSPEWSSLYGTPLWDALTEEQRITLTTHEMCSISGVGIWFECCSCSCCCATSTARTQHSRTSSRR